MSNRTMEVWEAILVTVGVLLMLMALVLGIWAVGAMVLMWAWSLFIVPVFGLPLLNFSQAFGAVLLLVLIRALATRGTEKAETKFVSRIKTRR